MRLPNVHNVTDENDLETVGKKRQYKISTIFITIYLCIGSITFGYTSGVIGNTLAQPSFLNYMGLDTASNATQLVGCVVALFFVGGIFGVAVNSYLADSIGRKWSIAIGAITVVISSALCAGSVNIGMFIVFRFFTGFGAFVLAMTVPLWITETVPPNVRGSFSQLHGFSLNVGYLLSSWVGYGFYFYEGPSVWRAPFAITAAPGLLLLAGLYWIPESPRYLLLKDRTDKAWTIVRNLHSTSQDSEHDYAKREFYQMQKQIELDRTLDSSYLTILKRPSYRKRAMLAIFVVFIVQSSGVSITANYGPTLYSNLGFSPEKQLLFTAGQYCISAPANLLPCLFVDRIPRPVALTIGLTLLLAVFSTFTGLAAVYTDSTNTSAQIAGVAMIWIFGGVFGATVDAPIYYYVSEIFPTHLRSKGMTIGVSTICVTFLIWTMSAPTAIRNIGWRFFLISIIFLVIGIVVIFFFFPDTKGKTLEDIAKLFGDDDLLVVHQRDIHVDENHEIVVDLHKSESDHATRST